MISDEKKRLIWKMHSHGETIRAIQKATHCSFRTVRKYITRGNRPKFTSDARSHTEVSKYMPEVRKWLESTFWQGKQRPDVKRIYELLEDNHGELPFSLRTLQRHVHEIMPEISKKLAHIPLEHIPGCAQIDFGVCSYRLEDEGERLFTGHYLVMVFPHSAKKAFILLPSENQECLLYALERLFAYFGGVPTHIRIDNPRTMVTRTKTGRDLNERFAHFAGYYGFEVEICTPAQAWQKGCVERAVDSLRRRFLSPIPTISSIEDFNEKQMKKFAILDDCKRYGTNSTIAELWPDDEAALKPLPDEEFYIPELQIRKTDKCGIVEIAGARYSTRSDLVQKQVKVYLGAFDIDIYDSDWKFVCRHKRCYEKNHLSMQYEGYVDSFAKRTASMSGCGLVPKAVERELSLLTERERKTVLYASFGKEVDRSQWPTVKRYEPMICQLKSLIHEYNNKK